MNSQKQIRIVFQIARLPATKKNISVKPTTLLLTTLLSISECLPFLDEIHSNGLIHSIVGQLLTNTNQNPKSLE